VVPAELVPAFVAFLPFADHPDQFGLLRLEPGLLIRLLLLRRHDGRELAGGTRSDVVFPEISALGRVRRETLGRKEDLAPVGAEPELTDLAGDREDRTRSAVLSPDVQRALPAQAAVSPETVRTAFDPGTRPTSSSVNSRSVPPARSTANQGSSSASWSGFGSSRQRK